MELLLSFSLLALLSNSISLVSSQYTMPDHYFINCGSNDDSTFPGNGNGNGNTFVGDVKRTTSFSVSGGDPVTSSNLSPGTPLIYQTARVSKKEFWYELPPDPGSVLLMVRLHFSPFSSGDYNSNDSNFNVSVSAGFSLLSNFQVQNLTVRDFFIPIRPGKRFGIKFTPSHSESQGSSFAFVNAIEAFTPPPELFINNSSLPHISPAGRMRNYRGLTSHALKPVYRINIGPNITVENDKLGRDWEPDDAFIYDSQLAINFGSFTGEIQYNMPDGATEFHAPPEVYRTARQLNLSSQANSMNITWNFDQVNNNSVYLVRAHFCDFISQVIDLPTFNFSIYNQRAQNISPSLIGRSAAPFYHDVVVESYDSRFVNISIGDPSNNNATVFLNGLEIMELLNNSGSWEIPKGKENKNIIIVGSVVGGVVAVLILLVGFFICLKSRKSKLVDEPEILPVPSYGGDSYTSLSINETTNYGSPAPVLNLGLRIPLADILQLTNNFDPKLMIGKGGFGKVYKGTLPNGVKVAVKRGEQGHGQGRPEFVTEIMVLSKIRHRHLVSLVGYCDEKSEMILVYEFMEKGPLQDHLYDFDEDYHPKLSWSQRLKICISAAQGLNYLHTGLEGGIIHRDVKSTNILLDQNFVAKVADFGISRLESSMDQSETDESSIKGSFGYLDPEYVRCLKLTQKSDVYSFGVVLLEVLCARPALDHKRPQKERNLAEWGISSIENGEIEKIVDPFLGGKINTNSLRKFLETVEKCLKDTGDERPNMVDVLWDLEYALQLQQTTMVREPHEDSTMSTSLGLPLPMLQRLPTDSMINLSEVNMEVNDSSTSSYPSASQVFSQLKIEDAR